MKNTCTLSDLISTYKPTLLKLDLEGLDTTVLLHTEEGLLTQLTYIVVEIENGSYEAQNVKDFLFNLGFNLRKVFSVQGEMIEDQSRALVNMHFTKQK